MKGYCSADCRDDVETVLPMERDGRLTGCQDFDGYNGRVVHPLAEVHRTAGT